MMFILRSLNICLGYWSNDPKLTMRKKGVIKGMDMFDTMISQLSKGGDSCDDACAVQVLSKYMTIFCIVPFHFCHLYIFKHCIVPVCVRYCELSSVETRG